MTDRHVSWTLESFELECNTPIGGDRSVAVERMMGICSEILGRPVLRTDLIATTLAECRAKLQSVRAT